MKFSKLIYTTLISGVVFLTSCEKVLDQKPQNSLDAATAYNDAASVNAGVIGAYNAFQQTGYYGLNYLIFADLYADNLAHVGTFPTWAQFANKQLLADNTDLSTIWTAIYNGINRVNTLIAAVPNVGDASLNKDATLAELRTMRAFMYFDLIRAFGGSVTGYNKGSGVGVPLFTAPTLVEGDAVPKARSSETEIYTQINSDLDFALNISSYAAKISNTARLGKNAAKALKARVQLYRGDYASAESLSSDVIANGGYTMISGANYPTIWSAKNTSESIFELQFDTQNRNFIAFYYYTTGTGGRNEVSSTTGLRDAHESTSDVRRAVNFSTTPNAKTLKYLKAGTGDDNVTLIRLAEMYLIRAEARARQNSLVNALADLNIVRTRAGLSAFVSVSQADILTQILKEDRVEFAHEGHRFFDIRRFDQVASLGITQNFRALWPIPQREVLTSNGIVTQNTGY